MTVSGYLSFPNFEDLKNKPEKKFPFSIPNLPNINTVELCLKKIFLILFTLFTIKP